MPKKEKVKNHIGRIVEVEVASEEETRLLSEQFCPNSKRTLQEALAQGHVLLEDFDRLLRNGSNQ